MGPGDGSPPGIFPKRQQQQQRRYRCRFQTVCFLWSLQQRIGHTQGRQPSDVLGHRLGRSSGQRLRSALDHPAPGQSLGDVRVGNGSKNQERNAVLRRWRRCGCHASAHVLPGPRNRFGVPLSSRGLRAPHTRRRFGSLDAAERRKARPQVHQRDERHPGHLPNDAAGGGLAFRRRRTAGTQAGARTDHGGARDPGRVQADAEHDTRPGQPVGGHPIVCGPRGRAVREDYPSDTRHL
mmetsp:Transcript_22985/g.48931  ORF Transcript_22985/g.48931 Transcript_22985/m.48931 type:complete len:237 (-) Transcript_22985:437-1147(-)